MLKIEVNRTENKRKAPDFSVWAVDPDDARLSGKLFCIHGYPGNDEKKAAILKEAFETYLATVPDAEAKIRAYEKGE